MRLPTAAFAVVCATSCVPSSGKVSGDSTPAKSDSPASLSAHEAIPAAEAPPEDVAPQPSTSAVQRLQAASPEAITVTLAADATMNFPFLFHALGGDTLVSSRNRIAHLSADRSKPDWSQADISDALPPGHYGGMQVELVGGRWPKHVVAVLADRRPRMDSVRKYFQRSGRGWAPWNMKPADHGVYVAFAPWGSDSSVGLQHVDMWSGNAKGFEPRIDVFPSGARPVVPEGYIPVSLATAGDGRLYAVASGPDDHRARLLVWGPGGGERESMSPLPEIAGHAPRAGDVRVLFAGSSALVVAGGVGEESDASWIPYLTSHADGEWTVMRTPDTVRGIVGSVARAGAGPLWFTTSNRHGPVNARWVAGRGDVPLVGQLWRADPNGDLHELAVTLDRKPDAAPPPAFAPRTIAMAGDRIWLAMEIDAEITDMSWLNLPCHALATAEL